MKKRVYQAEYETTEEYYAAAEKAQEKAWKRKNGKALQAEIGQAYQEMKQKEGKAAQ